MTVRKKKNMNQKKKNGAKTYEIDAWKISTIILALAVFGFIISVFSLNNNGITKEEATDRAMNFINNYALGGGNISASLVNSTEEHGIYSFIIEVNGQQGKFYISKDSELLIIPLQAIELSEIEAQASIQNNKTAQQN